MRERRKRQSAELQRIARLLQLPFSRLGQKGFEQRRLLRFRQRLRHIAARKLIRAADQPFCILRRSKNCNRCFRRKQLYLPRAECVRLTIGLRLTDSQKRQLPLTLRKQALAQRTQLRNAAAASIGQLVHHVHKLPCIHGTEEIAAKAVRQDEARVLLRNARSLQRVIGAEQRCCRVFKYHPLCVVRESRRNIPGLGKIDVAPGFDRKRGQPELDQKLLRQNGDIFKR